MGSLVVSLSLQYAEYTKGLDKAGQESLAFAQKNQRAMDQATAATDRFFTQMTANAVGLVAAYVSVTQVLDRVTGAFDKLGKLSDIAQETGASVENLSRILKVASATKFDASEVENGLIKLSKGMATVDSETNKVHNALTALGISATDSAGKMRDPAQVYIDVANKLAQYNDSANKAALATDLFGKIGAKQLPFLNDINEHIGKVSATSGDAARRVEALSESFGFMRVKTDALFTSFAIDLLPTLEKMVGAFSESSKGASAFGSAAKAVSVVMETLVVLGSEVAFVFKATGIEIGGMAAQLAAVAKLDFAGFKAIGKAMKEDAIAARIEHDKFIAAVMDGDKKVQELKLRPKDDGKDLDYLSGNGKKDVAAKISDFQRLTQEIAKLTAEEKKRLELHRELTPAEKRLVDLMADLASGAQKMTDQEIPLAKAMLATFDAQQKVRIESEKLKKVREEIAEIVTSATAANAEHIANLELENSLVGKNALQQQLLRSEYQANLALKREFAQIDKKTLGMTDPAAITKLKAESDGRIQLIKDEAKAKIEARFDVDAKGLFAVTKDKAITQAMGQMLMPDEVAKRTAAAQAEHTAALSKIADLDVIQGRIKIEGALKAKINTVTGEAQDAELARATGASILADEAAEKIAKYGADNVAYAEAALAISRDTGLQDRIGFDERNKQLQARIQFFTAEADAKKDALGISANQLAFDNANLTLQQQLLDIQQLSGDADEQQRLGLAYQIEKQERLLVLLTQQKNLDMSKVGSGEELIKINKELLDLSEKMAGLDIAAADKAKLKADSAARQVKEALILTEKASKEMWSSVLTQMNNDFRNSFLLMLNNGSATWRTFVKSLANTFKTQVADFIYKQFLTPIVAKVILSLAGVVGANGLASAATAAANGGQLMGGGVSASNWLSIGKSLYDGISGGFTAFGQSFAQGVNQLGQFAYAKGMSQTGNALMGSSASGTMATAASYIGAAAAGITIGTFIAGDKSVFGINGLTSSALGAAAGAYIGNVVFPVIGGLVGTFVGGIVGGAFNAAFGMGPKKSGTTTIAGNYSGAGFSGGLNTPWTQKGGWFRSNKSGVNTQALNEDQQSSLNGLMMPAVSAFGKLIAVSGDAARSLDGWGFAINRAIANDADMKTLQIDIANSMGTKLLPELVKFQLTGESLADTAVRMADTYIITDSIFKMLGFTAADTGIASLKMRDSLVALMGGFSSANATMESYYKNFYSADEQQANSWRQISDAFKSIGLVAPATRDEFRALAETLVKDVTPAGQSLFASVMRLNPAFASATQGVEELAKAAKNSLSSALKSAIADLSPMSRATAQAQISAALMIAKVGGPLPTADSLSGALDTIKRPGHDLFATATDYNRDQQITANDLSELLIISDTRISIAGQTLSVLTSTQELIRTLQNEVAALRASAEATAISTRKTIDLLTNVTQGGNSLLTTPA